VLNVSNAFALSLLSAAIDLLPLLGISGFFIPWIVYAFIVGDTTFAFYLIALLVVVIITRQILEPKITGESLGVSAFTMLAFMIISLSLFGVMGLIMSPILIILIKALYEQGYLRRWIRLPAGEFPNLPKDEHPAASEETSDRV
jgi:predicted PurR-regulated permease PerM